MSLRTDEQMNVLEGLLIGKTYGEIVPVQIEQIAKFLLVN